MKRLISIVISFSILIFIYTQLDTAQMVSILKGSDLRLLGLGILFTVPLYYIHGLRLKWIVELKDSLSMFESIKLICLANTLNFLLPSKLGDLSKGYFLFKHHHMNKNQAISMIILEKALDLIGLVTVCFVGLAGFGYAKAYPILTFIMLVGTIVTSLFIISRKLVHIKFYWYKILLPTFIVSFLKPIFHHWFGIQHELNGKVGTTLRFMGISILLSFMHFFQLWIMYRSILPEFPLSVHLALSPITILAGLLPLAFSGVGTRDAAIVIAFSAYVTEEASASMGILATARMLILAIPGIPFISSYFKNSSEIKRM